LFTVDQPKEGQKGKSSCFICISKDHPIFFPMVPNSLS
jgi:hypothetical protein